MTLIKFSTDIISASTSKRELTGVIVPFGKVGHTNMGDVVFNAGSLKIEDGIKLFTEHDNFFEFDSNLIPDLSNFTKEELVHQ